METSTKSPRPARAASALPWIAGILGFLLLTLAAALRAEADAFTAKASRTQDFNASGAIKSLSVEAVNGDVEVAAGAGFTANVSLTVRAATESLAKRILDQTKTTFENRDGELALVTEEPGTRVRRSGRKWDLKVDRDGSDRYRVEAKYRITLPQQASLQVSVVNGAISSKGITGELELTSVNGRIEFAGVRRSATLKTVNGRIEGLLAELPKEAEIEAETVNGNVTLRLPANAAFRFSGRTMNGEIVSTFALPSSEREEEAARAQRERARAQREKAREAKEKARAEVERTREKAREKAHVIVIDTDETEWAEGMEEFAREMERFGEEIARSVTIDLNRTYEGTVGGGGASVRLNTLNGRIALLKEGTTEDQAKSLVRSRTARVITIPPVPPLPKMVVRVPPVPPVPPVPRTPRAPRAPRAPAPPEPDEEEVAIVRGDVQGDFLSTLPIGEVRLGRVSGQVKIKTHSGDIRVLAAGKGADLSTSGGDVKIDAVTGDLTAVTYGGNVTAGSVSGDARLETMGGDVTLRSCGGSATAKTAGGDVTLSKVKGSVKAETAGGSIVCEATGTEPKGGITLTTGGGDVTLTLPANFKGDLDVRVSGVDPESDYIVSEFPELTLTKRTSRHGAQTAEGKLNGGGAKVTIRTSSGTVTLKKGPAA